MNPRSHLVWLALLVSCAPEASPSASAPTRPADAPSATAVAPLDIERAPDVPEAAPGGVPGVARVQEPAVAAPGSVVKVREFHPNGRIFTERSERIGEQGTARRVGPMKVWFENGQLRCEGGYDDDGTLSGHWRYWDERGALLREGDFALGLREGDWVEYHPNGRKRYEGLLHLGLNEGPWTYWHGNGQRMAEGSYVNNRREGPWLFWDEQGSPDPRLSGLYKDNVRVQ